MVPELRAISGFGRRRESDPIGGGSNFILFLFKFLAIRKLGLRDFRKELYLTNRIHLGNFNSLLMSCK